MNKTLRGILKKRFSLYPDDSLFSFKKNDSADICKVTTKEFFHDVAVLGGELLNRGYKKSNIAIYGENSYAWILAYFAITASGNTAVLLDYHLPENELSKLIVFTDCKCVLYSPSYEDIGSAIERKTGIPFFETEVLFEESCRRSREENIKACEAITVLADDPASIAFTSGTSGEFKGVVLSNGNLTSDIESLKRELQSKGTFLQILPFYHLFGLLSPIYAMFVNQCIYIEDSLRNVTEDTAKYQFDLIAAVPAMLPLLFEGYRNNENGKKVRIVCGGAPEDKSMLTKLIGIGVDVYIGYGMTECSPCIAIGHDYNGINDTFMHVIDVNTVTIDEPDENGIGEILVSGDNVMLDYYKMPEETEKVLRDGVLRTGDLGMLDKNGRLTVTGRKKNIIALPNGEKVSPEAVEQKVRLINGVSECMLELQNGMLILSVWAPDGDRDSIQKEIVDLNRTFPSSKRIAKTVFSETSFAVNSIGKIIRKKTGKP